MYLCTRGNGTQIDAMDEMVGKETRGTDAEVSGDDLDTNELKGFIPKLPTFSLAMIFYIDKKVKTQNPTEIRNVFCSVVILLIIFGIAALRIFLALMFIVDVLCING